MAREKDEAYTSQPILDVFKEIGEQGDKRDSRGLRHPMYCILVLVLLGFLFGPKHAPRAKRQRMWYTSDSRLRSKTKLSNLVKTSHSPLW